MPPPWRLEIHESLSSTSDLVVARAEAGEAAGLAVLALLQTAGRGSRGRGWSAPRGNLNLSVLLRPSGEAGRADRLGCWALLAGLALHDAFAGLGAADLALKWPNDLLLRGRKLAGILVDGAIEAGRLRWLSIGMGANLSAAPSLDRATACLAEALPVPPDPVDASASVLASLSARMAQWRAEGFGSLRAAWLARALPVGSACVVRAGGRAIEGRFAGLSDEGALLLERNGRIERYATGEVMTGSSCVRS